MDILDKLHTRSQDVYYGCKLDSEGVRKLQSPNLARVNEVVGAYFCALYLAGGISGMAIRGVPSEDFIDAVNLPRPSVRRAIGMGINSAVVIGAAVVMNHYDISPIGFISETITELIHSSHGK